MQPITPGFVWGADAALVGFGAGGMLGGWGWPRERTGTQRDKPLGLLTEQEWRQMLVWSRHMADRNALAVGFLGHVVNFVVGDGFDWTVTLRGNLPAAPADRDRDGVPDKDPAVVACQRVLDEWREFAGWGTAAARVSPDDLDGDDCSPPVDLEAESFRRAVRDGEAILRFFAGGREDGYLPSVRAVEPECVRSPGGDPAASWGVVCDRHDPHRRKAYLIGHPDDPTAAEPVPAGRAVHLKSNVDGAIKRGVSDFFPVGEDLRSIRVLLRNMGETAGILSAMAYIRQHAPGTTSTQLTNQITAATDMNAYRLSLTGERTRPVQFREPGEVLDISAGKQYLPPPMQTGAPLFIQVEQAMLRGVGFRWGCPEYFSGDASNANFASTLVSGGPFERAARRRQKVWWTPLQDQKTTSENSRSAPP